MKMQATLIDLMRAGLENIDQKAQEKQLEHLVVTSDDEESDERVHFIKTDKGWSYQDPQDIERSFESLQKAIENYIERNFVAFLVKYGEESDLRPNLAKVIDLTSRYLDKEITTEQLLENKGLFEKINDDYAQLHEYLEYYPISDLLTKEISRSYEKYPQLTLAMDYIPYRGIFAADLIGALNYCEDKHINEWMIKSVHYKSVGLHSALQCIHDTITDMRLNPVGCVPPLLKPTDE